MKPSLKVYLSWLIRHIYILDFLLERYLSSQRKTFLMGSSSHQNQYPYFDHVKTYCLGNYPASPSTFPVIQGETTLFPVMSAYDNSEGW
jgi:hypothetical protein